MKFGQIERGKTLFDTMMMSYPKRTDLWIVYVDTLTKAGDVEGARYVSSTYSLSYIACLLITQPRNYDYSILFANDCALCIASVHIPSFCRRQVLERCVTLQLPAKKMKSIFQKFLDFETHHGSEERKDYVRQKALEYVEAKSNSAEGAD